MATRLGTIESFIIVWAYNKHFKSAKQSDIKKYDKFTIYMGPRLAKSSVMIAYARDVLGLPIPERWYIYKRLESDAAADQRKKRTGKYSRKRIYQGFNDMLRRAMPDTPEQEVQRLIRRLHSSFTRAFKSLREKGLIAYDWGHSGVGDQTALRIAGVSGFALTSEGNALAKRLAENPAEADEAEGEF